MNLPRLTREEATIIAIIALAILALWVGLNG